MINPELIEKGYSLSVPIISPERKKLFHTLTALFVTGIILSVIAFIINYFQGYSVLYRIMIGSGLLLVAGTSALKKFLKLHEKIGIFTISKERILLDYEKKKPDIEFKYSEIIQIRFVYSGFEGELYHSKYELAPVETGLENFLLLKTGSGEFIIELLIESKQRAEYLAEFFKYLQSIYKINVLWK